MSTLEEYMRISVIVPTFGDDPQWESYAERALESVHHQTIKPYEVIRSRGDTLADARNKGAAQATGTWLCFCDADDKLHPEFIEAMIAGIAKSIAASDSPHHLLQPATRGFYPDGWEDNDAVVIAPKCNPMTRQPDLRWGNHLVVSTLVERDVFQRAGGFGDEPIAEDWSLWLRCWALGARPVPVPDAVYYVFVRPDSRNKTAPDNKWFTEMRTNFGKWCREHGVSPQT